MAMLIKQAGLRKVNYRFLSLHFPLLAKLLTQICQRTQILGGEPYVHIGALSRIPPVGHVLMNSVGRAGERERRNTLHLLWERIG